MKTNTIIIGNNVQVLFADATWEGRVVDETKNTIHLLTKTKEKVFEKQRITIKIDGKVIQGVDLVGRIEERIKKSIR